MLHEYPDAPALRRIFESTALDQLANAERDRLHAEGEPMASQKTGYKRNYTKLARRKELVVHLRERGKPIRGELRMRTNH